MDNARAIDAINLHPRTELSQIYIMPAKDLTTKADPEFSEQRLLIHNPYYIILAFFFSPELHVSERYRSGCNGPDSKSGYRLWRYVGSNPTLSVFYFLSTLAFLSCAKFVPTVFRFIKIQPFDCSVHRF